MFNEINQEKHNVIMMRVDLVMIKQDYEMLIPGYIRCCLFYEVIHKKENGRRAPSFKF